MPKCIIYNVQSFSDGFSCIVEILNVKVWSTLIKMSLKDESSEQKAELEIELRKKEEEEEEEKSMALR